MRLNPDFSSFLLFQSPLEAPPVTSVLSNARRKSKCTQSWFCNCRAGCEAMRWTVWVELPDHLRYMFHIHVWNHRRVLISACTVLKDSPTLQATMTSTIHQPWFGSQNIPFPSPSEHPMVPSQCLQAHLACWDHHLTYALPWGHSYRPPGDGSICWNQDSGMMITWLPH